MSEFAELWADARIDLDQQFGDLFTYHPMATADVNGRPGIDATRPALTITAIYTAAGKKLQAEARGKAGNWVSSTVASPAMIDVVAADFGGLSPRRGDVFVRTSDGARFAAGDLFPDDEGRIVIHATVLPPLIGTVGL